MPHPAIISPPDYLSILGQRIASLAGVEKLFLLGTATTLLSTDSVFLPATGPAGTTAQYFLLVLINDSEGPQQHAIQDKIENGLREEVPISAIVLLLGQFNHWLASGHPFACMAVRAPLIYDGGQLLHHPAAVNEDHWMQARQQALDRGTSRASGFLAGAELFRLRRQNGLAAFMLHQCLEQALMTLVFADTGYRPQTHNLARLLRYAGLVHPGLAELLNFHGQAGKQLLVKLQQAYIDARYKDYAVSAHELIGLEERMHILLVKLQVPDKGGVGKGAGMG